VKSVHAECSSCRGTGLYEGFCERNGHPVICVTCGGSGREVIFYRPFAGRREKHGVESVSRSRGSFIATGVGAVGESMSYADFKQKIREGKSDGR
jgi:hypothetical protein